MGAQGGCPCFQSYLCSTVQIFGKFTLPPSPISQVFFFYQIFLHFCPYSPSSHEFFIQSCCFVCILFPPLHATLFLHSAAVVLSLILLRGLALTFLLSFSFRLLFPSLNMFSCFLPSHLAFHSSPPITWCYISQV